MTCLATVRTPTVLAAAAAAVCLVVAASSFSAEDADGAGGTGAPALPPSGGIDYQLGGAYEPPAGTTVVVRDASADPVEGVYSVCYLNAFQSQPGTADSWGDLLLRDASGAPVADPDWPDEFLLDTSNAVRRAEIADRLAPEIRGCADATEFTGLCRSGDPLEQTVRRDLGLVSPEEPDYAFDRC